MITKPGVYKPEILFIEYTLGKIEFKNDAIIAIPTTVYIFEIFPVTGFNFTIFFDKTFNSTKVTIELYIQSLNEEDWPVIIWPCYNGTPTWYPVYLYVKKGKTYKVVISYPGTIETYPKTITYIYHKREFIKVTKPQ